MNTIEKKFLERGFPEELTKAQRQRTTTVPRSDLLTDKQREPSNRTPFTTTYNHHHPPIRSIINKHWHLLETDRKSAAAFQERPIVAFKRNKNLCEILGGTHVSRGKKIIRQPKNNRRKQGSYACLSSTKNQCCNQIKSTKTFTSQTTGETLDILHSLNCKSLNSIYLGECALGCPNTQYVGKSEPPAHLRFNTHRSDVKKPKGGAFDHHFALPGHNFDKHAKFTLIEQVRNHSKNPKMVNRRLLEDREDYWMSRLRTIKPHGLNDSYNNPVRARLHDICV